MDKLAFNNLKFLLNKEDFEKNHYKIQGYQFLPTEEDETFDTVYDVDDLKYPVYFTFHQLINHVNTSYTKYEGKSRIELIKLMGEALNNLYDHCIDIKTKDVEFQDMLNDLDDKIFYLDQYYRYGWCMCFPGIMNELINGLCGILLSTGRDISDFYYKNMYVHRDQEEDEEEAVTATESDDESSDEGSNEGSDEGEDEDSDEDKDKKD